MWRSPKACNVQKGKENRRRTTANQHTDPHGDRPKRETNGTTTVRWASKPPRQIPQQRPTCKQAINPHTMIKNSQTRTTERSVLASKSSGLRTSSCPVRPGLLRYRGHSLEPGRCSAVLCNIRCHSRVLQEMRDLRTSQLQQLVGVRRLHLSAQCKYLAAERLSVHTAFHHRGVAHVSRDTQVAALGSSQNTHQFLHSSAFKGVQVLHHIATARSYFTHRALCERSIKMVMMAFLCSAVT